MDYLRILQSKYLYISLFLLALLGGLWYYYTSYQTEQKEKQRWKENYENVADSLKDKQDELGRTESRVKVLRLKKGDLEEKLDEKSNLIQNLKRELEFSDIQIDRLKEVTYLNLKTEDTGKTVIRDTIVKKIKRDYLTVADSNLYFRAWWQKKDSVDYRYRYQEQILYWTELKRQMFNEKGNKRFFLWRWIWPNWKKETYIKSTNKESQIEAINLKKE